MKRDRNRFLSVHLWTLTGIFLWMVLPGRIYAQTPPPANEVEQVDFATGLFQKGLYDMSITEYQKYLADFPQGSYVQESYLGIAENMYFKGDYLSAQTAYRLYIEMFPEGKFLPVSRLRLGEAYYMTKDYEKAELFLSQVAPEDLEGALQQTLYYYLAETQMALGHPDKAVKYFSAASEVAGQTQFTARAFLEMGDVAFHMEHFQEAVDDYSKAYAQAQTDDEKALSLQKQGETLYRMGDFKNAITFFEKVIKDYPKQNLQADALTDLLMAEFQLKDYETVINMYKEKAAEMPQGPKSFALLYPVINAYIESGRYDEALKLIDQVQAIADLTPEDKYNGCLKKAEILGKQKKFDAALKVLEDEAAPVTQNNAQLEYLKAEIFYSAAQPEKAAEQYSKVISGFPQSDYADESLYALAYVHKSLDKKEEALREFEQYTQDGKDEAKKADALYNVILLQKDSGDLKSAIDNAQKYLSAAGKGAGEENMQFVLADLYSSDGMYEQSNDVLKDYIEKFSNGSHIQQAHFLLGFNYQSQKKFEDAFTYYAKVQTDKTGREDNRFRIMAQKNMAVMLLADNKTSEAAAIYDGLIMEFGGDVLSPKTYFWVSQLYLKLGQYNDVLRIMDELQKIKTLSDEDKVGASFFSAEAQRSLAHYEQASKLYDEVLKAKNGKSFMGKAYLGKGLCLATQQKWDKAKEFLSKAAEADQDDNPTVMKARIALGDIERSLGNDEAALKYYMLVAILYKDQEATPEALYKAGNILEKLKRTDEALKFYQEIAGDFEQSPFKQQAVDRIQAVKGGQ